MFTHNTESFVPCDQHSVHSRSLKVFSFFFKSPPPHTHTPQHPPHPQHPTHHPTPPTPTPHPHTPTTPCPTRIMANTLIPPGQQRTVELMSVAEDRPRARVVKNKKRHGLDKRSGALQYLRKPRGRVTGNSLHIPLGLRLSFGQRTLRMLRYAVLRTPLLLRWGWLVEGVSCCCCC